MRAMTGMDNEQPTPQLKSHCGWGRLQRQGRSLVEEASGWFLKACVFPTGNSGQCSMPHNESKIPGSPSS